LPSKRPCREAPPRTFVDDIGRDGRLLEKRKDMDPTLAPNYVPPSNGRDKPMKGHHWAEIQKKRARAEANDSDAGINVNGTGSSTPVYNSSGQETTSGPPQDTHRRDPQMPHHPRASSWRGGISSLSDGEGIGGPADLEEVPIGVKRQALRLEDYAFPVHRLRTIMDGASPPFRV
jgi:hypothetical protein